MFRFSDVKEDRLFVTQEKTGHKLALPLDLELKAAGLVLENIAMTKKYLDARGSEYVMV